MRKALPLIPIVVLCWGCNYVPTIPGLGAHKIDIQQGNHVTQEMVDKLKPGMSRSQVRFALGTPLIVDPFHTDRWDYVYVFEKQGRLVEKRRIVVVFKDNTLLRIEGDVTPKAAVVPAAAPAKPAEPTEPAK